MVRLISIGIGTVSTIAVMLPVMLILRGTAFKRYTTTQFILIFIYAAYLSAVFTVVGIPSLKSILISADFNLIPFADILSSPREYIVNTVLNIVLFVPFGFFLAALWKEYRSLKKTLAAGMGLSLFIEILQIFTFRLTDIDDLITNTLGAVIGYYLLNGVSENIRLKLSVSDSKYEPLVICSVVVLLMVTIQPLISSAIWEYVLSSPIWENIK